MMQQYETSQLSDSEIKQRSAKYKIGQSILQTLGASMVLGIGGVITTALIAKTAGAAMLFGIGGVAVLAVGLIYCATKFAVAGNEMDHEEQARKIRGVSKGLDKTQNKAQEKEISVALTQEPVKLPHTPVEAHAHAMHTDEAPATDIPGTTISHVHHQHKLVEPQLARAI